MIVREGSELRGSLRIVFAIEQVDRLIKGLGRGLLLVADVEPDSDSDKDQDYYRDRGQNDAHEVVGDIVASRLEKAHELVGLAEFLAGKPMRVMSARRHR